MTQYVTVLNPVPGEAPTVKFRRAKALVKEKFAQWVEHAKSIRLVRYTEEQMAKVQRWLDQMAGYDYNVETDRATFAEIKALPCVMPAKLFSNAPKVPIDVQLRRKYEGWLGYRPPTISK